MEELIIPFDEPLHEALLSTDKVSDRADPGPVIVADSVSVQPLASVTVTVYVPAVSPVMVAAEAELLHR